jgi:hypothetical protein
MTEDEKFEMTWGELLEIVSDRDKRTIEVVDAFVSLVRMAVEQHPQGDLYDFLAFETAAFAVLVVSGKVIDISDPRQFFRTCGFDSEAVERMFIQFQLGVKTDQKLKLLEAGKVVE